jgi:serine/threonine protein kinase
MSAVTHTRTDIKGGNILVDSNGTVKLADFGASKKLADIVSFSEGCKTVLGSPYWMAPEVIQQGYGNEGVSASSYGRKADIWSVGAVVIEMATGRPPFAELAPVTALFKIGSSGQIPAFPASLSDKAKDFLTLCFQRDVKLRPSASELLSHIFFQDEYERAHLDDDTSSTRLSSLTSSQASLFGTTSSVKSSDKLSKSPPSVKPTPPPQPPPIPATASKAESAESDEEEDLDDVISFLRERTKV